MPHFVRLDIPDPAYLEAAKRRFESKVDRSGGPSVCHEWTASRGTTGYGQFGFADRIVNAHRVAYLFANGEWPAPCCLHLCNNRGCVNATHLRAGTHEENSQQAVREGRWVVANRVLSEQDIERMRTMLRAGVKQKEVAAVFNVNQSVVTRRGVHSILKDLGGDLVDLSEIGRRVNVPARRLYYLKDRGKLPESDIKLGRREFWDWLAKGEAFRLQTTVG